MSENGSGETPVAVTTSAPAAPAANSVDELPQWAQKEIRDLRDECAQRRQKVTSLEADLQGARNERATVEAGLNQRIADSALELARFRAAVTSGIPADHIDDFASRLRGSTAEELDADAKSLAAYFNQSQAPAADASAPRVSGVDPSQGRGNGGSAPNNPAAELQSQIMSILGR